jgi:hypothetical protein
VKKARAAIHVIYYISKVVSKLNPPSFVVNPSWQRSTNSPSSKVVYMMQLLASERYGELPLENLSRWTSRRSSFL